MTMITKEFNDPGHDTEAVLFSDHFEAITCPIEKRTFLFPKNKRDRVIRPIDGTIILEAL